MGSFRINGVHVPNMLHAEGLDLLWEEAWTGLGEHEYAIGVGGLNILDASDRRPDTLWSQTDPVPAWFPKINAETTYADVLRAYMHEGGSANNFWDGGDKGTHVDGFHANLMGYERQAVTFSTKLSGHQCLATTDEVIFRNQVAWTGQRFTKDALNAPDSHGYPWNVPVIAPGSMDAAFAGEGSGFSRVDGRWRMFCNDIDVADHAWDSDWAVWVRGERYTIYDNATTGGEKYIDFEGSDAGQFDIYGSHANVSWPFTVRMDTETVQHLEDNIWRHVGLPLLAAFVVVDESALLASCQFMADVRLAPGGLLRVAWTGGVSNPIGSDG